MAILTLRALVRRLGQGTNSSDENRDGELLARFVTHRDEAAFELLVWRHGAMVLGLCRRMLPCEQDAEDAFQATFLALAREAHRIGKRDSLGGWLYRVAFRIALKLRTAGHRMVPCPVPDRAGTDTTTAVDAAEFRAVLDEEICKLPVRYRLPFVLCCLAGRSNSEAAAEIGCPRGTVDSRLSWAKHRLRARLLKRGVAPTVAAIALESVIASDAAATVPAEFIRDTVRSSLAFLDGVPGALPAPAALARGVLHTMFYDRLKRMAFAVLAVAILATGAGWVTIYAQTDDKAKTDKAPAAAQKADKPSAAPKTGEPAGLLKPAAPPKRIVAGPASERNQALRASLDRVVDIDRPINASLRDVLEFLSDRFDLTIHVDEIAFMRRDPPLENVLETAVKLPKLPGITIHNVLDLLLAPLSDRQKVVVIVKRGAIFITCAKSRESVMTYTGPAFLEYVKLSADDQPFTEAIRELMDQTGANIVIDGRAKEQAKKLVSAQLQDAPLLTAVHVLADAVELKVVLMDNVIYVTTPENALKWKQHQAAMSEIDAPKPVVPERPKEKDKK